MADICQIAPPLSQGVGYGIIVGVGAAFAIGMSLASWYLARYMNEVQDAEMFMTAKHSVKTGLTASAVVSSWTIAATLLTSASYGYQYGVSGPFWYGAGACVQILLFSVAAIELKRKAPYAQTYLQIVRVRYGATAHIVFSTYSLVFQVIQTVNLLVGGSAVFSTMTGTSRDAACFLLPVGVVIYTLAGGIKATFITDWVHTVIIYIVMLTSIFVVYTSSSTIGSPNQMWMLLREAASLHPVNGNAEGSYLTMNSIQGGYVGLIFVGSGFSAAVDSQLFQKAIAADPRSTSKGYLLGGLAWFTIPFVLASTFGLAAAATEHLPSFPTYPNRMNAYEVSSGMAMPYAAMAVMGKGGVVAVLLMVFMAVTSAMSSETVATSALLSYNVYRPYINPQATPQQVKRFSEFAAVVFAIVAAGIACGFNHAGFSVNFLVTAIGIFVDSAIVPTACTIMWKRQSKLAVIVSPLVSSAAALIAWLLKAHTEYGEITIASLSGNLPLVAGNMMSLCGPLVLTPLLTFLKPEDFHWNFLKEQIRPDEEHTSTTEIPYQTGPMASPKETPSAETSVHQTEDTTLLRSRKRSIIASVTLTLILLVIWPIPMYASKYVFSRGFFTGWVVVLFLWAFFAASTITLIPIWEGRKPVAKLIHGLFNRQEKIVLEGVPVENVKVASSTNNFKA